MKRANDFSIKINLENPIEAAEEMVQLRQADSTWIHQKPLEYEYKNLELKDEQYRYTINHHVPFECLFLPDKNKKLYVAFSGGGTKAGRKYPSFLRWKYKRFLNGNMLFIDDPMYYYHSEFPYAMWYYGTKEESYLCYVLDIVKKVMGIINVHPKDVVFMGSSAGGYAALFCANKLNYSSAIAMNPQIILEKWQYPVVYTHFSKMGIDLSKEDIFGRNEIQLTNKKSRFFVVMNMNSKKEYQEQFIPFFEKHRIEPKFGISQKGNIAMWLHATDYTDPHSAIPLKKEIVFIDYLLEKMKKRFQLNKISNISLLCNEILYDEFNLKTELEKSEIEKKFVYEYMQELSADTMKKVLNELIKEDERFGLLAFLKGDINVYSYVWKRGHIVFYLGSQKLCRYNIIYHENKLYLRLLVDKYRENLSRENDLKEMLSKMVENQKITRWRIEENDRLVIAKKLETKDVENQMRTFVQLTLDLLEMHICDN